MNIDELVREAFRTARNKGWHDTPATFGDRVALCHSELSEALEAYRDVYEPAMSPMEPLYRNPETGSLTRDSGAYKEVFEERGLSGGPEYVHKFVPHKPEGVGAELADVVIRIADMCGLYGIDLQARIEEKMEYNLTRPYRHGNKKL